MGDIKTGYFFLGKTMAKKLVRMLYEKSSLQFGTETSEEDRSFHVRESKIISVPGLTI